MEMSYVGSTANTSDIHLGVQYKHADIMSVDGHYTPLERLWKVSIPGASGAFCLPLFLAGACCACSASLCSKGKGLMPKHSNFNSTFPHLWLPFICLGRIVFVRTVR